MKLKLKWNDKHHRTGIKVIDAQHKEMFDHVDRLVQVAKEDERRDEFVDLLYFLGGYAVEHFRCEAELMEREGCSKFGETKDDHHKLMAELEGVKTRFEQEGNSEDLREHALAVVVQLLGTHVAGIDTRSRKAQSN